MSVPVTVVLERLFRLISHRRGDAPDPRNRALEMAMDWDGDWHAPLGPRLRKELPFAASDEIDRIATECAEAMRVGLDLAFSLGRAARGTAPPGQDEFQQQLWTRYPWVSEENASRLWRQGLYYAFKTGKTPEP